MLRGDVSRNFTIHARFPDGGFIGQTKVSPQLAALAAASPQGGTYKAHGGSDNIPRIFVRADCRPPLIAVVGLGIKDTFAGWWREAAGLGALAALFCLLTALGGWGLLRAWNARQGAYLEIQALNGALEQDIVARKAAEEALRRHEDQLEETVQMRTSELLSPATPPKPRTKPRASSWQTRATSCAHP